MAGRRPRLRRPWTSRSALASRSPAAILRPSGLDQRDVIWLARALVQNVSNAMLGASRVRECVGFSGFDATRILSYNPAL